MALRMLLQIAWRNLFVHRQRLVLVAGMVGVSTALLVLLLAVGGGVAHAQRRAVTTLLSGELNVGGFYKVHPDTISIAIADAPAVRQVVAGVLPSRCTLRERGRGHATLAADRHRSASFIVGVDPAQEREGELFQLLGPKEGSLAALAEPDAIALSATIAGELHVKLGDLVTLYGSTTTGRRNAVDGRVVAITGNVGLLGQSSGLVVSSGVMRNLFGFKPGVVSVLQASCGGAVDLTLLQDQVRGALKQAGYELLPPDRTGFAEKLGPQVRESWRGQRLDVNTWQDEAYFLSFVTDGLGALSAVLQGVVLVITVCGLFLSMSMAVRERTREIGTLRAMGMQRTGVVGVFVLEGLLTGLLASSVGALVAWGLSAVLDDRLALPELLSTLLLNPTLLLRVPPGTIILTVALVSAGAALGAIIPAAKAASLSPRAAMESIR